MKLTPFAQSIELPPPRPTIRSTPCRRANSVPAATSRSVGFSFTPSNVNTASPASAITRSARRGWPACSGPGSVTSRTRVPPSDRASSPSRFSPPASNTSRPGGWKSNAGGLAGVLEGALLVEVGEQIPFMRLVPRQAVGRQRPDVQPLDVRAGHHLGDESGVLGDRRGGQGVPDPLQDVGLRAFYHGGVGEQELLVRQRVVRRIAEHDRRQQPRA